MLNSILKDQKITRHNKHLRQQRWTYGEEQREIQKWKKSSTNTFKEWRIYDCLIKYLPGPLQEDGRQEGRRRAGEKALTKKWERERERWLLGVNLERTKDPILLLLVVHCLLILTCFYIQKSTSLSNLKTKTKPNFILTNLSYEID